MSSQNISHCSGDDCFKLKLNYEGTTMRQLKALIDVSQKCQQEIKVMKNNGVIAKYRLLTMAVGQNLFIQIVS